MQTSHVNPIVFPIAGGPAIAAGVKVAEGLGASYGFVPGLVAGAALAGVLAAVLAYALQMTINGLAQPTE